MGIRRRYFIRSEFQRRGCVHYHTMISISHNDVDERDVYSDNPEVAKKVKDFVEARLTSMLLKRDVNQDQTHAKNTTTGLIDDSIIEAEDSFQYHPKPVELYQHILCHNDDSRRLPFNDALNYERNHDGLYIDPKVGKQYRNLQLSSFMSYCCQSCWKYNKGYDRCCRHMYLDEAAKLNTTIETTKNKHTRVLPPRNNAHLQTSCTSPLYHLA